VAGEFDGDGKTGGVRVFAFDWNIWPTQGLGVAIVTVQSWCVSTAKVKGTTARTVRPSIFSIPRVVRINRLSGVA
jgi:hypothetical protein